MTESLRDLTAHELARFLTDVGLDDPWSETADNTRMRYAAGGVLYDPERLRLHQAIIDDVRAESAPVEQGRSLAVVITAGPPGAGKSTAMSAMPDLAGFRHVDADEFKDPLLELAAGDGSLTSWLDHMLADGRPVAARELAGFVHAESTEIADEFRRQAFTAGENVVVHGTLANTDYIDDLLDEMDEAGYGRLIVVDVEVDREVALEQAIERWWRVRDADAHPLGGRFVPPAAFDAYYPAGPAVSVCAANARALVDRARSMEWDVEMRDV